VVEALLSGTGEIQMRHALSRKRVGMQKAHFVTI